MTDYLVNRKGEKVRLEEPKGIEFPARGFEVKDAGYVAPAEDGSSIEVAVDPKSDRLQLLEPFPAWDGQDFRDLYVLIKVKGKCTTDHISMAGPWLRYRGHLENISNNLLIGAVNYANDKTNSIRNQLNGEYETVPEVAKQYKQKGIGSVIVGDENYGEGSSREHAAMEPRFMNVKVVLVRSFARIHETNLKKQGILALTFADKGDYDRIGEDDSIGITGLKDFAPGKPLMAVISHPDGSQDRFPVNHSYNENQIEWFKAGSALNLIKVKGNGER
jgi:aconitate hydratase